MSKILRVDMTNLDVNAEDVSAQYESLGGRGLSSAIVGREVIPTCDPLGRHNKLVIATGLLSGTTAPCSGRISIGAKSPLTRGIKETNAGGTASQKIARLGFRAIVLEGQPRKDTWHVLVLNKKGLSFEAADDLVGLGNYETVERLKNTYGEKVAIISIGQAGEMGLANSSVAITDTDGLPNRHAGRGGLGSVIGSKGVKAIVIDDTGTRPVQAKDKEAFKLAAKEFTAELRKGAGFIGTLMAYGTPGGIDMFNTVGSFPTKNFSAGSFDGASKINGQTIAELNKERGGKMHACTPGCVIRCSIAFHDKDENYVVSGFEYETVAMLGSNLLIDDLDTIAEINRMCNDYGLDTIEMGSALGVAMEGGLLEFGDTAGAKELVREVAEGSTLGRVLGNGAAVTGRVFGVRRIPVVKGQGLPAHAPFTVKLVGVTYCTSPMGADHTAGISYEEPILDPKGQVDRSRAHQIDTAFLDSTGLCMFVGGCPGRPGYVSRMLSALQGSTFTEEDMLRIGGSILKQERAFNEAAGFTTSDDRLPEFMTEETFAPNDSVFDVPYDEVDRFYDF